MRLCPPKVTTEVEPEGYGSAASLVVSQDPKDPGGWILDVFALFKDKNASRLFIGTLTLGAPNNLGRRPARVVATLAIPASYRYVCMVRAPTGTQPIEGLLVGIFCGETTPFSFTSLNP